MGNSLAACHKPERSKRSNARKNKSVEEVNDVHDYETSTERNNNRRFTKRKEQLISKTQSQKDVLKNKLGSSGIYAVVDVKNVNLVQQVDRIDVGDLLKIDYEERNPNAKCVNVIVQKKKVPECTHVRSDQKAKIVTEDGLFDNVNHNDHGRHHYSNVQRNKNINNNKSNNANHEYDAVMDKKSVRSSTQHIPVAFNGKARYKHISDAQLKPARSSVHCNAKVIQNRIARKDEERRKSMPVSSYSKQQVHRRERDHLKGLTLEAAKIYFYNEQKFLDTKKWVQTLTPPSAQDIEDFNKSDEDDNDDQRHPLTNDYDRKKNSFLKNIKNGIGSGGTALMMPMTLHRSLQDVARKLSEKKSFKRSKHKSQILEHTGASKTPSIIMYGLNGNDICHYLSDNNNNNNDNNNVTNIQTNKQISDKNEARMCSANQKAETTSKRDNFEFKNLEDSRRYQDCTNIPLWKLHEGISIFEQSIRYEYNASIQPDPRGHSMYTFDEHLYEIQNQYILSEVEDAISHVKLLDDYIGLRKCRFVRSILILAFTKIIRNREKGACGRQLKFMFNCKRNKGRLLKCCFQPIVYANEESAVKYLAVSMDGSALKTRTAEIDALLKNAKKSSDVQEIPSLVGNLFEEMKNDNDFVHDRDSFVKKIVSQNCNLMWKLVNRTKADEIISSLQMSWFECHEAGEKNAIYANIPENAQIQIDSRFVKSDSFLYENEKANESTVVNKSF